MYSIDLLGEAGRSEQTAPIRNADDQAAWLATVLDAPEADPVGRVIGASMREYRPALPQPKLFTDDELGSIRVPTLVLIAGRSVIHDPQRAFARAQALIPNVQVELWPEATHSISGQLADEVNARVLRFIERVDARVQT